MAGKRPEYFSYVLRIWQDDEGDRPIWRASLEGSLSGQGHHFASLDDLFVFLRIKTGAMCNANDNEAGTELTSNVTSE